MKSVRLSIMTMTCMLVVVSMLIMSGVSIFLNVQTANGALEQTMLAMADDVSVRLYNHLRVYKVVAQNTAADMRIYNSDASLEEKQDVIDELTSEYKDFTRANVLDMNGTSVFTGDNFADREYFQMAIRGSTWVSDPLISKVTGAVTIILAVPIWENGVSGTNVVGVMYLVPIESFLNDAVATVSVSKGSSAQIINKNGTVVANANMDIVAGETNVQNLATEDSSLNTLAALEREMMGGKTGFGRYTQNGEATVLGYAPIPESNGWSISVSAPVSDFMEYTNRSIVIIIIMLIISIAVALVVSSSVAVRIGNPLKKLSSTLANIANTGQVDIGTEAERQFEAYSKSKNEIGTLAVAASGLVRMLNENSKELITIASGDLTGDIVSKSDSDAIGNALTEMCDNLNRMFTDINISAKHVTNTSRQISDVSNSFAQSSTEQAAAVEQLSASISEISEKTKSNAQIAGTAAKLADTIKDNAEKGSRQMEEMMSAIKEINDAGQGISKVIKVIDDIAFQTNILALNAAVEAARAGQHGKGFAVVAEEVRSLAAKSAEAAKDTGGLIANSIEKAEFGARIATETAASLDEIVSGINESSRLVGNIAVSSDEQSQGIFEITKGIEQVAEVVQRNSATAQESSAASVEMNEQAIALDSLISRFKIKEGASTPNALPDRFQR